jgi:hypothetical protein
MNLVVPDDFIAQLGRNIHVTALANPAGNFHHGGASAARKDQLVA